MGYGFGAGWRLGGMGMGGTSTTTEQDYQVGTLVVDLWRSELEVARFSRYRLPDDQRQPAEEH